MSEKVIGNFTEQNLKQLNNTVSIVRQVCATHPYMGTRVAFLKTCDMADMACLQVGVPGVGKTKALLALKSMAHKPIFTKKFTLAASRRFTKLFSNSSNTWISLEMEDLTDIVVENMLRVVGDLITDHSCEINTASYSCNITNANISWLAACTYEMYNKLWQLSTWRGNSRDRVLRYFVWAVKRNVVNTADPAPRITINAPPIEDIEIQTILFPDVVEMLEMQFEFTRATEYAERLLKGSASLNHRKKATDADAKFLLLQRPCIEAEKWASSRRTISSPLKLDIDALQLLAEAITRYGVSIPYLVRRNNLESGPGEIIAAAYRYKTLFKKIGDWIFPHPTLMVEKIIPMMDFEQYCLKVGEKYY